MHFLWLFFLRKRQFSILLMVVLIALGTYSVFVIPKESAPEVIIPIGIVTTIYPGASSSEIEELITNKLEDAIENVDDLVNLTSTSRDGMSSIIAEFNAKADIDKSIQNLKDAVDRGKSDLPTDANDPVVTEVNFADQPILMLGVSANLSPVAFTELGEKLEDEFSSVSGVSNVIVSGTRTRIVQVIVKNELLRLYNLGINNITTALAQSDASLPVGTISTAGIEYAVRFEGKVSDISDIENLPIGSKSGATVYLRDVATVNYAVDKQSTISRVSVESSPAETSMTLSIYKKSGLDVTTVTDAVFMKLAELQSEDGLLQDSQVLTVFDQGKQVRKDLNKLIKVGFETVFLVVLCLLLTIGWRESLVAALSIPLSFVIAFIGLYLSGNTINFISLFSLILAVGILVDSGIVVTEAIHTRVRKFGDVNKAAIEAIREYAWPLIGGTMTSVAVFAPLFFLSGIVGKFIASIPFTIIFVLSASIFVALGMVPLIAIYLTNNTHSNRFEEMQERYTLKIQLWYREKLITFLKNRFQQNILIWGLALALIISFFLPVSGMLKVIFFPPDNADYVFVELETKQGTPVTQTDLFIRTVEEILYDKDCIESFTSTVGSGSFFTGSTDSGGKFGNITINLRPESTLSSAEIAKELRDLFSEIKDVTISVSEQQSGPPTGAPVFIKFIGEDLDSLLIVSDRAEKILSEIDGARDIVSSTKSNATEFVLTVDKAKASALGVSPTAVGALLRSAVFGINATTISRSGQDIDVVVKLQVDKASTDFSATPEITLEALRNLEVTSFSGTNVPLSSVISESLAPANASINHEDKKRIVSVSAYTEDKVVAGDIVAEFKKHQNELELPNSVAISYGGETEDVNETFTEMFLALIVGLMLMLGILVLSFNSIRYSLYLLLAVPYSLIGVFFGLAVTGLALSFTSLLGVIALSGVIINHAIILLDSLITHKASTTGSTTLIEQVADAAVSRLRPIVLTTITTVVGMIPLSHISGFWSPLAYAIMFGLSFAMILTLVLVPTLFYRAEKKKEVKLNKIS
ncbi:hypothetical protein A2592_01380 [Candidatus Kaiserbacteria bacterium RIFOXYD1_FULL_42_15]|uniref:SSD domain-containing protein n=1 Tax=Candidatus Kaiserbacteria bacterium RIFOXYD1_FULL_42_15 TaxID=1798532 RepID=A0A1F6FU59_9BACT|nr:MAG: hypothetical protein A2592_01380 [Candidatus Kaiserbacteria bacterium RIFOXYD1_FULL_42_15]